MIKEKVRLTLIYDSKPSFIFRLIVFVGLINISLFIYLTSNVFPSIPLFILSIFLIVEIFIKYGMENIFPKVLLSQSHKNFPDTFTKEALESIYFKNSTADIFKYLIKFPASKFFLEKAVIDIKNIKMIEVDQEILINKALEIALKIKGKYVATTDLLTAYLLLTEDSTKTLFELKLQEEDVMNIASWTRSLFLEEELKIAKARFVGIGIGETLVWGWTYETKNYTKNLTFLNIKRKATIDGRENEYKRFLEILQKKQGNNVLLVGEIGTGKSNLLENLIYQSYEAELGKDLNHRRFLELMIGPFIAGTENRAELESRLQAMIDELKHSGNIILYIPEFQNLIGASSYEIDLSGAILPYLNDGDMPIVATITHDQFKKYFETSSLTEVFEVIKLEEPNSDVALKMLFQKTDEIEVQNGIKLSYKAIVAAVKYADKYELTALLPGTAVDLLNNVSNSIRLEKGKNAEVLEEDVIKKVEEKSNIPIGMPKEPEKKLLLNFESKMHEYIIGQEEAVHLISEAMRRIRAGLTREKPISFLFLGPTGVGKTETAKTLAKLYFQGEAHIIRVDMSEYSSDDAVSKMLQSGSNSFVDQVQAHPFSLILLDEFEKANEKVHNLFLQVLDDGRLTDESGKTISFNNSLIIATSNAGSEFIRQNLVNHTKLENKYLLDHLERDGQFKPELLNRFDEIVIFRPLNQIEINQVTQIMIKELVDKMSEQDIILIVDPKATQEIANKGFDAEFGARPLRRYIQDNLEDSIAKKILNNEITRGDKVSISIDSNLNLTINKV